jgi:hypothetical protein
MFVSVLCLHLGRGVGNTCDQNQDHNLYRMDRNEPTEWIAFFYNSYVITPFMALLARTDVPILLQLPSLSICLIRLAFRLVIPYGVSTILVWMRYE